MIGLLTCCVLNLPRQGHLPETLAGDMRDARRSFYSQRPYPIDDGSLAYSKEVYRQILHRYGHQPAARAGLARCLFYQGHYARAETQFKLAGSAYTRDARRAARYFEKAGAIARALNGASVLQIAQVPDSDLWVAMTGRSLGFQDRFDELFSHVGLALVSFGPNGNVRAVDRRPFRLSRHNGGVANPPQEDEATAFLYILRRSRRAKGWNAVVERFYPGGDSEPAAVQTADITPRGFRNVRVFGGLQGINVYPPTQSHNLLITAAPTFKVWWPDIYEWVDGRFVFANARHPEFYSQADYGWTDQESEYYYPMWMNRAAIYDIHRQWQKALTMWRRAERSCGKTIRTEHQRSSEYHDVGFYGQARVNLKEIRMRIRWIERRDFNHALLYRPYDFDVQVSPYRLGSARGVQYQNPGP